MDTSTPARRIFVATDMDSRVHVAAALVKVGGGWTRDESEADRWNGWARPLFNRAAMTEIVRMLDEFRDEFPEECTEWIAVDPIRDEFRHVVRVDGFPDESVVLRPYAEIDGEAVWEISGWTFDTVPNVDLVINVVHEATGDEARTTPLPRLDDAALGVTTTTYVEGVGATYLLADYPDPSLIGWDVVWDSLASHVLGEAFLKALGATDTKGITAETVCQQNAWIVDDMQETDQHDPLLGE